MRATRLAALAVGAILAGCSTTETTTYPETTTASAGDVVVNTNARIPFVQYGGIRDWRTDNDRELYAQGSDRRWYRVELMGPCTGLEFANGVRFLPSDSAGTFDRFSWIVANGQRCKVDRVEALQSEPTVANHPRPRVRAPSTS
jgi:hypothetical protein